MSGIDIFVVGGIIVCCLGFPIVGVPMILLALVVGWSELNRREP